MLIPQKHFGATNEEGNIIYIMYTIKDFPFQLHGIARK